MKVAVTGSDGFLGWHLRVRASALRPDLEVISVTRSDWPRLPAMLAGADAVVHLAGVNRGDDDLVRDGNIALARDVVAALGPQGARLVFANSIQSGNSTPYGIGKATASQLLAEAAAGWGTPYTEARLPNLFGEQGRPYYNSFVQTMVALAANGSAPEQIDDRPIGLLHAQQAAQLLLDAVDGPGQTLIPQPHQIRLSQVWQLLAEFRADYANGTIPEIGDDFRLDLFNTYRAALFPHGYPIRLEPRSDPRGRLVEGIRTRGVGGQAFVSTTNPGFSRGEHFHLRKIERFWVLDGRAEIALRRHLTDEVVTFQVSGDEPVAIDMPTMWTHNLTAADTVVTTMFWTNELFDPQHPDTYPEPVRPRA